MKAEELNEKTCPEAPPTDRAARFRRLWSRWVIWVYRRVPPGARTLLGLVVLAGGVLGFLPILGFWMIPLGLVIISLDFRPLSRSWRRRRGRLATASSAASNPD